MKEDGGAIILTADEDGAFFAITTPENMRKRTPYMKGDEHVFYFGIDLLYPMYLESDLQHLCREVPKRL